MQTYPRLLFGYNLEEAEGPSNRLIMHFGDHLQREGVPGEFGGQVQEKRWATTGW